MLRLYQTDRKNQVYIYNKHHFIDGSNVNIYKISQKGDKGVGVTRYFFNKYNIGRHNFVTPGKQLQYVAESKPDQTAIISIDKEERVSKITWNELHVCSNQLAWMLKEKGAQSGTVILDAFPNGIEHMIAALAIWKAGACYFPLSHKSSEKEIEEISSVVSPFGAFSDFHMPGAGFCIGNKEIYDVMKKYPKEMPPDMRADPNMITLSGGTSGKLKCIRQNIPSGMSDEILKTWFQISGMQFDQRQLLVGPMFHGAPHTAAFNGIFCGNTLVIPRNLCAENIVRMIKEYEIEFIQMVPTLMSRIAKLPDIKKEDFASITALCHTGGFCPVHLKRLWIDLLAPEKIYEIYSMTEVIGITYIRGDDWLKHLGSIGCPVGDGKISVRDEQGNELPPYYTGEIYMTSPGGYFLTENMNERPLEVKQEGYRSVGDIGYVDEEGYLYFSDRRSDMLVVGGENVFATEVETALMLHESIADAVVVGIPDEEWGRRMHAIVESDKKISEAELRDFLKKYLSPYKIPGSFEVTRHIDRGEDGKTDRKKLLQECIAKGW